MATMPEEDEPQPTARERVTKAVIIPVERNHIPILLSVAAGAGSLAPFPFGPVVAVTCVMAAFGIARKR